MLQIYAIQLISGNSSLLDDLMEVAAVQEALVAHQSSLAITSSSTENSNMNQYNHKGHSREEADQEGRRNLAVREVREVLEEVEVHQVPLVAKLRTHS